MPPPKRPCATSEADVAVLGGGTRLATRDTVEDGSRLGTVVNALRADLALANGLRAAGLDPAQAAEVRAAEPPTVEALEPDADTGGNAGVVTVTNILLFILLQTYGAWVLTGVTREKSSRVVEVLLAVIRPIHLLSGKIAGIGAAALLHAVVLIVVAFVATRDRRRGHRRQPARRRPHRRHRLVPARLRPVLHGPRRRRVAVRSRSRTPRARRSRSCCRCCSPTSCRSPPSTAPARCCGCSPSSRRPPCWRCRRCTPIGAAPLWAVFISMVLTVVAIVLVAKLAAKIYERSVLHTGRKLSWREAFRNRDELPAASRTPAVQSERAAERERTFVSD